MKLWIAGAALAAPFVTLAPQGTLSPTPLQIAPPQRNLLGNGGFQSWSFGTSFQGPLAPDSWYAMGTTTNFFGQSAMAFTQVADACATPGQWMAEIRANQPNNFLSQKLEDFTGLGGQWVTFSVDVGSPFTDAHPQLVIDDGVGSSSAVGEVPQGTIERVTVQHRVSTCATRLEFKIVPEQTVQVDNAMAVAGKLNEVRYVPRRNTEPGLMELPIGAVIDWHRFKPSIPLPEGFKICDGTNVNDAESPINGEATPDIRDRFVRGVQNAAPTGIASGADTHSHGGTTGENQGGPGQPAGDNWLMNVNQPPPFLFVARDGHTHAFTTNSRPNVPAYVGLLKIIRIK